MPATIDDSNLFYYCFIRLDYHFFFAGVYFQLVHLNKFFHFLKQIDDTIVPLYGYYERMILTTI